MIKSIKRCGKRIKKVAGAGLAIAGWTTINMILYAAILRRALSGEEVEEDQQQEGNK